MKTNHTNSHSRRLARRADARKSQSAFIRSHLELHSLADGHFSFLTLEGMPFYGLPDVDESGEPPVSFLPLAFIRDKKPLYDIDVANLLDLLGEQPQFSVSCPQCEITCTVFMHEVDNLRADYGLDSYDYSPEKFQAAFQRLKDIHFPLSSSTTH
jgi:hypothetical protein